MNDKMPTQEVRNFQIPEDLQEYPPEQLKNLPTIMQVMRNLQKTEQD